MIRRWTKADTLAVAEIERASFTDPWSVNMLEESLSNPAFYGFVDEDGGEIRGYVGIIFAGDAEIALIATDPKHRRLGIGKSLLTEATSFAFDGGAENIFLEVRASNVAARSLYEGFGFVSIGIRPKYYGDGEDAIVMVLPKNTIDKK